MRKLKFTLDPSKNRTEEQYFTDDDKTLAYKVNVDRIEGVEDLKILLQNVKGQTDTIPINNQTPKGKVDVSIFGYCWLEWAKIDRQYSLNVELE